MAQLAALRLCTDEVTFVGGEPVQSSLLDAVVAACAAGFVRVGVQTNGRALARRGVAESLARSGLTDVHVSLHGAEASVHDYHTGVPGSFAQLLAGVGASRAAGLTVVATTVLTRSNFRVLNGIPWLLHGRNVGAWCISVPHAAGRAEAGFDRVYPRLGLALPYALHALEAARRVGLAAWISGAPLCALGPYGDRALPSLARSYAPVCEACPARVDCPGLDARYLARFGGDELRALAAVPARAEVHALASLFVGAGELSPSPAVPIPADVPAEARRSLPVLGKVKPALAEATSATPRRSGDALREIFPDLFTPKEP